jgi:arginase
VADTKNIVIIEALSELGAGTRGPSIGPTALRLRDLSKNRRLAEMHCVTLSTYNQMLHSRPENQWAKNIGAIIDFNKGLKTLVNRELSKGKFVLLLSGDHSNAIGGVAGFRQAMNSSVSVVWIDAHGDLHSPWSSPSGNLHGMPLAAILGLDNKDVAVRTPSIEEQQLWNEVKNLNKNVEGKSLKPEDLLLLDIRDLEEEEWTQLRTLNIAHLKNEEMDANGIHRVLDWVKVRIKPTKPVYLSFDVDSLDPQISDGTGTTFPGGLQIQQTIDLLKGLILNHDVRVLEITEVNPLLDTRSRTVDTTLEIIEEVLFH